MTYNESSFIRKSELIEFEFGLNESISTINPNPTSFLNSKQNTNNKYNNRFIRNKFSFSSIGSYKKNEGDLDEYRNKCELIKKRYPFLKESIYLNQINNPEKRIQKLRNHSEGVKQLDKVRNFLNDSYEEVSHIKNQDEVTPNNNLHTNKFISGLVCGYNIDKDLNLICLSENEKAHHILQSFFNKP